MHKGINEYMVYEEMWALVSIQVVICIIYLAFSVTVCNIYIYIYFRGGVPFSVMLIKNVWFSNIVSTS